MSQKISLSTATIVSMNAMIGASIFTIPVALAIKTGPAGIITVLLVALGVWFMAGAFARLAKVFPKDGSFYTYAKSWGGHTAGVIASYAYLTGLMIALGLLIRLASYALQYYYPDYSVLTLGLVILAVVLFLNSCGIKVSALGQYILIVLTVFPLLATIFLCLAKLNLNYLTPFAPFGWLNILTASQIVIFSFFGFESITSLFGIVKNPEQNVPKATAYSVMLVALIYLLFIGSIILAVPLNLFTSASVPLATILLQIFPTATWLIQMISLSIIISIIGTIHAMIWSSSNLLVSLTNKLASPWAKQLCKNKWFNHRTAVLLIGLLILTTFLTLNNINMFFNLTALFIVLAYGLSIVALLKIKTERNFNSLIKTYLGLGTILAIIIFATAGLITEIAKLF